MISDAIMRDDIEQVLMNHDHLATRALVDDLITVVVDAYEVGLREGRRT